MIEQSSSLQQSGVFSLSYKKHQKLVRHNDSSSKVKIDLYLFQPSFHPGRPVWCLESAAALPILVHSVIKNRLKVTVKYQPLTPKNGGKVTPGGQTHLMEWQYFVLNKKLYLVVDL